MIGYVSGQSTVIDFSEQICESKFTLPGTASAIGEGSAFHQAYGYYAQGVGPDTATLPGGRQRRLARVENQHTDGYAGLCLGVHDLALSKYVARREKDRAFTRELARNALIDRTILLGRLDATKLGTAVARLVKARIARDFPSKTPRR